jgi:NADH-quinone oxidoreductase subunit N
MTITSIVTALAPEIILLIAACTALLLGIARGSSAMVAPVALAAVLLALFVSAGQTTFEDTTVPIGLWLTSLTFYTRVIALSVGALIILANWNQPVISERGEYMAMVLLSLLGVLLTASANDLILLFFAIELVSVPTYVLIALSRDDRRASEASVKYFFLGALSAALLAYGLSFLYGVAGSTSLYAVSDGIGISLVPSGAALGSLGLIGLLLVFGGLLFKVAAVPFHVYVADVYEGAASPVTGLLGFVPKAAGFVALIKVFSACNWELPASVWWVVWLVAVATMTLGNVLALLQKNAKRILAYSSVSHTGYMLIGLLVGPVAGSGPLQDGVAALLFYIGVYGVMNLGAFAFLGAFRIGEREVESLDELAGMAVKAPAASLGLAVCVFSLMGFPPTAGMIGKIYLFGSAFSSGTGHPFYGPLVALAIIAVINTAIGAAYYLRIVAAVYLGRPSEAVQPVGGGPIRVGLAFCALSMVVLFALPWALTRPAREATVVLHHSVRAQNREATAEPAVDPKAPMPTTISLKSASPE